MTLEDYFYRQEENIDKFPGRNNYISAYKDFKNFMDNQVHKEVKSMTMLKDDGTIY